MSAATSIIAFLLAVILGLIAAVIGAIFGHQWWRNRQEREKMRRALTQAQIYALLNGARMPAPRRPTAPATPAQGGSHIIIVGGQQPAPQLTLDDLREQPDPLAGLLPPNENEWEVL